MAFLKIFKRVEIKYLLDEREMNKLIERIKPYLEEDKYFKSEIVPHFFIPNFKQCNNFAVYPAIFIF